MRASKLHNRPRRTQPNSANPLHFPFRHCSIYYEPPEGVFGGESTYDDPRTKWETYLEAHMQYAKHMLAKGKHLAWAH